MRAVDLIDLVGFAGAAIVLAAYALTNARSIRATPKTLALMNLGAGALALNGLVHHAWPSMVVNTVWFVIAAITLGRHLTPNRLVASGRAGAQRRRSNTVEFEHDRRRDDDARIVRGSHDRASGRSFLFQHPDDPFDRRLVLLRGRLVQQQQRRRADQSTREGGPLSLAAGEELHRLVEQPGQGQPVGELLDDLLLARGTAHPRR